MFPLWQNHNSRPITHTHAHKKHSCLVCLSDKQLLPVRLGIILNIHNVFEIISLVISNQAATLWTLWIFKYTFYLAIKFPKYVFKWVLWSFLAHESTRAIIFDLILNRLTIFGQSWKVHCDKWIWTVSMNWTSN